MLRSVALLVLVMSAVASAQPVEPVSDWGQQLPRGAWPGVSLEELRGMRECTLEDPAPKVGSEVTCRPPVLPSRAHVSFGVGWATGFAIGDGDVQGVHHLDLDAQYWLARTFALGARYSLAGIGTSGIGETGIANELMVAAQVRAFTDEADRDAITFEVAGGQALRPMTLGGNGTVVRAAIARDTGYITREKTAVTWRWELAYEQGLEAGTPRTLTAGVRAGIEMGIRAPRNLAERDRDPPIRSALAGEARFSPDIGVGASLDVALADSVLWRTTGFWQTLREEGASHGIRATWGLVTGPRVIFLPRSSIAPYLDVQAGPAALGGATGLQAGVLAEAEAGLTIHVFCQTRIDLGGRIQTEIEDGVAWRTGFFMLRVSHGTALRRSADACRAERPTASSF